jgi:hypothetical protein
MVKRKIVAKLVAQEELSVSNMNNFARISSAIEREGYSDKLVKYLANNVLKNKRTTGVSVVKALVGCACKKDYKLNFDVEVGKRQRGRAIHALFGINQSGINSHSALIYNTFQREEDLELKLGLGLLLIVNNLPLTVKDWMMNNLKNDTIWEAAYFNALTGAIVWQGQSYGFSDTDSIWQNDLDMILDNADMLKLKKVLTHPDYQADSLRQSLKNHGSVQLKQIFETVAKHMDGSNINMACDIMREVNGWSVIQEDDIQDLLNTHFSDYNAGSITLNYIDSEVPQILPEVDNWNEMYSFRQWLKLLARNVRIVETEIPRFSALNISSEYTETIDKLRTMAFKTREILDDIRSIIEEAGEYGIRYKRIFSIL